MDILKLAFPMVGILGAFMLAVLAFKQRTILDFFGRGLDQLEALKSLPAKDRLDGLEIIDNTLKIDKIDTSKLTATQAFALITKTLEEKSRTAKQKFTAYIFFSVLVGLMAFGFFLNEVLFNVESKIESALSADSVGANAALNERDFYKTSDPKLAGKLGAETDFSNMPPEKAYEKLRQKICEEPNSEGCNQAIRDLRNRAKLREPPFNEIGAQVKFGIPGEPAQQPFRFTLNVDQDFEYKNQVVELIYNGRRLILFARPRITGISDENFVHFNDSQANFIGASRVSAKSSPEAGKPSYIDVAFVRPIFKEDPDLFDPSCTSYWKANNPSLCADDIGESIPLSVLLAALRK